MEQENNPQRCTAGDKTENWLTRNQVKEILRLYPDHPAAMIAAQFGQPVNKIYMTAKRYGVQKSEAFRNSPLSGRIRKGQRLSPGTEFKKGRIPPVKGKKRADIRKSREERNKNLSTRWKKGNRPHTTKHDGAISVRRVIRPNGVMRYKFIRISEGKWVFLNRYLWEKTHGAIPAGDNVVFKDENTLNCTIENLECISNAELIERNRGTRYPLDLKRLIRTRNKLQKTLKQQNDE